MMIAKLILLTTLISIIYSSSQQYSPLNSAQISELLYRHNLYRAMKCQAPLTWDPIAATVAYNYAIGCTYAHNPNRNSQYLAAGYNCPNDRWSDCTYTLGENIAEGTTGYYSISDFVDLWVGENKTFQCPYLGDESCNCGHYTQVMWSSTFQVGCGLASCSGMDYLVCDYNVPGNYNPATTPVFPSEYCTSGKSTCSNGSPSTAKQSNESPSTELQSNGSPSTAPQPTTPSETTIVITIQVSVHAPLTSNQLKNLSSVIVLLYELPGVMNVAITNSYDAVTHTYTFTISAIVSTVNDLSFQKQAKATSTVDYVKTAVSQQTANTGNVGSYIVNGSQQINSNLAPNFIDTYWWIFVVIGGVVVIAIAIVIIVFMMKKNAFKLAPNKINGPKGATLNTSEINPATNNGNSNGV